MSEMVDTEAARPILKNILGGLEDVERNHSEATETSARQKPIFEIGYVGAVAALMGIGLRSLKQIGIEPPEEGVEYSGVLCGRKEGVSSEVKPVSFKDWAKQICPQPELK